MVSSARSLIAAGTAGKARHLVVLVKQQSLANARLPTCRRPYFTARCCARGCSAGGISNRPARTAACTRRPDCRRGNVRGVRMATHVVTSALCTDLFPLLTSDKASARHKSGGRSETPIRSESETGLAQDGAARRLHGLWARYRKE